MQGWEGVVLGAIIALVSGSVTEVVRSELARKKEERERRESYQRKALVDLLDLLENIRTSLALLRLELEESNYRRDVPSDHATVIAANYYRLERYLLVSPAHISSDVIDAWESVRPAVEATNAEEADAQIGTALIETGRAMQRIGKRLQSL